MSEGGHSDSRLGRALAERASRPGPDCQVAVLLRRLPPEDATALVAYMRMPNIAASSILDALRSLESDEHGLPVYSVQEQALRRHRRRLQRLDGVPDVRGQECACRV